MYLLGHHGLNSIYRGLFRTENNAASCPQRVSTSKAHLPIIQSFGGVIYNSRTNK